MGHPLGRMPCLSPCFERSQSGLRNATRDAALYFLQQFLNIDRLVDEASAAVVFGPFSRQNRSRRHNDRRRRSLGFLDFFEEMPAVQDRQKHVEQDQVRGWVAVQMLYPIFVLIAMLLPSVRAAFRGEPLATPAPQTSSGALR